jgi:hypothetical protein
MRFVPYLRCTIKLLLFFTRNPHKRIVTIHVGKDPSTATSFIHADFLTHCSHFFQSSFNGTFMEGPSSTMILPETTPTAFGVFVDWAYRHQLMVHSNSVNLTDYVGLWLLADKLIIPELQSSSIVAIERFATKERLKELDFEKIWHECIPGCEPRSMFVENIVRHMLELTPTGDLPPEILVELFKFLQTFRVQAREVPRDGHYKLSNGHLIRMRCVAGSEKDTPLPEVDFICDVSGFRNESDQKSEITEVGHCVELLRMTGNCRVLDEVW